MAIIHLVRHAKAAGSFTEDLDPGLDELGQKQAIDVCALLENIMPLELFSSPLKRAQETAQPLVDQTSTEVKIEKRVAEIPSPNLSLDQRGAWLTGVMAGNWLEQSEKLQEWRSNLASCLLSVEKDSVIFSHFVAINCAVSLTGCDDRVLQFRPDNCSVTSIETDGKTLKLIQLGKEASTNIN